MNKKNASVEKLGETLYVLYVDIMGFKDRVNATSHQALSRNLYQFREDLKRWFSPFTKKTNTFKMSMFSDSILIVDEDSLDGFNRISKAAVGVMYVALQNSFAVKGAIAKGAFTYDETDQLFFGKALVDAYLLHESLHFYGIIAHHSIEADIKESHPKKNAWVKSPISLKGGDSSHYHIAYNLVDNKRKVGVDSTKLYLEQLSLIEETVSGIPRMYVDKTIKILEKDSQLFNSLIKKESLKDKAPEDLFPLSERDERLLLADAEVGEDVVEGVVAGDVATCNFADGGNGVPEVECQ
ncbi:hypothetical protein HQ40_06360 [Porphyromonas gulae]|uniref:hypothetical protein n=1 Tax=Porphyromonas gulae TaxID=111105 RepID=UPI00052C8C5E|nr:hypothetical protein [Porphyromonas gulae]KGN75281.1 hypothetical protein HQ40_06360 [Porphyromonas gulae]